MAFKYTGDATLGVGLTVEAPKPLDNRTVVNSLTDLYSIPEKYAYQGMTVANVDNGNIYMLVDKSKIKLKEGWKASYESILIIACTEEEYKEWSNNTTDDFKPKDENKTYLHAETYYYIYEDSMDDNLFYLSAEWGKEIEKSLALKALNTTVVQIRLDLDLTIDELSLYATLNNLDTSDPESLLSLALNSYYTKELANDTFLSKKNAESTYATLESLTDLSTLIAEDYVTKESLRGDSPETGDDDFIFVTLKKYSEDLVAASKEFHTELLKSTSIETSDITILKIVEKEVQLETTGVELVIESSVKITTEDNKLLASGKLIALTEEVPKLLCLPLVDYDNLVENNLTEEDTYYCTYGELSILDTGYVRSEYLIERYYTKTEVKELISAAIEEVQKRIDSLLPGSAGNVRVDNDELLIF